MILDYPSILAARKRVLIVSGWREDENGRQRMSLPLEIDGVAVAGLSLRLGAIRWMPDKKVTAQIDCKQGARTEPLTRCEWRPIRPHRNNGLGPEQFKFKEIAGTHVHRFEDNWVAAQGEFLGENLPVAVPIDPDPKNFGQLLALLAGEFRIENASEIPIP